MSTYLRQAHALAVALLLALGLALGFAGVQHAYADEGDAIDIGDFSFYVDNDWVGSDVLAGLDEGAVVEELGLSLYYWNDDDESVYLEYGTDYQVLGWYYWDEDEEEFIELDSYPTEPGYYRVKVEGIGSYTGTNATSFEVYDGYEVYRYWTLVIDESYEVDEDYEVAYAGGALVYPTFTVYDDYDEAVDSSEYSMAVMRGNEDDGYEEVVDGEMAGGWYELRVTPAEESPYHGYISQTFFVRDDSSLANAEVDGLWDLVVRGKATVTPKISATLAGTALVEGQDYKVSYRKATREYDEYDWEYTYIDGDPITPPLGFGVYKAILTGMGAYEGDEWSDYFTIDNELDLNMADFNLNSDAYAYTGKPVKIDYTLKAYDGSTLVEGKDFRLLYCMWDDLGGPDDSGAMYGDPTETAPVDICDYSDTAYAVYAEGIGDYSGVTYAARFTIVEPNDLSAAVVKMDSDRYAYTGSAIVPAFEVVMPGQGGDTVLVEGRDYEASYDDGAVDVGSYSISIWAIDEGRYTGSKYASFYICRPINGAVVTVADQAYTGQALKPEVKVVLDGKTLPADTYDVVYANNVSGPTATVTVTGRLYDDYYEYVGYMGTATGTFKITGAPTPPVSDVVIAAPVAKAGLVYTGKEQVGVAAGKGYTVSGGSATNAGSYTATATAAAGYAFAGGSKTATVKWAIAKAGNTLKVKAASKVISAKADGKTTVKAKKAFKVTANASAGKVTYKLGSVPKKLKGKVTVAKSGKVTIKKGAKTGTYTVKVKATSAATANYNAKTVTVKLKVNVK